MTIQGLFLAQEQSNMAFWKLFSLNDTFYFNINANLHSALCNPSYIPVFCLLLIYVNRYLPPLRPLIRTIELVILPMYILSHCHKALLVENVLLYLWNTERDNIWMKNDIVFLLINVNMNRVLENECKKWILVYNRKYLWFLTP